MLSIKLIAIDDGDNTVKFDIKFSNHAVTCSLEFYAYADVFKTFAQQLIDFPKNIKDVVVFEIGEDNPKCAYYLLVKIFFDDSGPL